MHSMATYLNTDTWARRDAFAYFRSFDKPYFSVCVRLDVAPLRAALATRSAAAGQQPGKAGGLTLACYHLALCLANAQQPFRLRLEAGRVRMHEVVHGSTTVLRADESFGFAYLRHTSSYAQFAAAAAAQISAVRDGKAPFEPRVDEQALLHFTTLPWLHFSSFSHARNWGREDSVPKLAFGRIDTQGAHQWMPCSVEVHHALVDGLHVGRYVQALEAALQDPLRWLDSADTAAVLDIKGGETQ